MLRREKIATISVVRTDTIARGRTLPLTIRRLRAASGTWRVEHRARTNLAAVHVDRYKRREEALTMGTGKHYFVEQTADRRYAVRAKGAPRAAAILDTQREAIEHVKELNPNDHPDVERVRNTKAGGRDKWRPS